MTDPQQQTRCCRFAAVGPAGRRYRSIAAAAAGECGQCHVVSVRRQLNTDLFIYFTIMIVDNWRIAGSLGRPFSMRKYKYIFFQIKFCYSDLPHSLASRNVDWLIMSRNRIHVGSPFYHRKTDEPQMSQFGGRFAWARKTVN